jgi:hypothetical protein
VTVFGILAVVPVAVSAKRSAAHPPLLKVEVPVFLLYPVASSSISRFTKTS